MFVLVNVGERIGSGLQNIRYVWNALMLPEPQLKEMYSPDRLSLVIPLLKDEVIVSSGVGEVSEPAFVYKVPDKVPDNLTGNQRRILDLLLVDNQLSMMDLSKEIGISKRKILDNINKLREMNLLSRIGGNRDGYWKVSVR